MRNVLFLISASSRDGDNVDLFVIANSEAGALNLWRRYFDLEPRAMPDRLILVPTLTPVEVTGKGGAIHWDAMVQIVYDKTARRMACITPEDDIKARAAVDGLVRS